MHKLNIRTMVLGPISTNTYVCKVFKSDGSDAQTTVVKHEDTFEDAYADLSGDVSEDIPEDASGDAAVPADAAGGTSAGAFADTSAGAFAGTSAGAFAGRSAGAFNTPAFTPEQKPVGCFIVDPASNADAIIEAIGDVTPSAIFLTHGHFDHLMAVNDLRDKYPGIKVYAHPADAEIMLHPGRSIVRREFTKQAVRDFVPVRDGEALSVAGVHISIISTPGHTKGGVCYYIAEHKVMFTGDTLFRESYGRTDFEGGDFDELRDSIENRLFARLKNAGHVDILPGHMEHTTLEHEMECNPILG